MLTDGDVTAIIVHFGDARPTVERAHEWSRLVGSVFIVANDLSEAPDDLGPDIIWLLPTRNLGFAGGFMFAASSVQTPIIVALNTDVQVDSNCLSHCLIEFDDPRVGIVGPTLCTPLGELLSGAGGLSNLLRRPTYLNAVCGPSCDADWVTGAVMFIRREVLSDIPFDCSYFLLFEDVDFCISARQIGWRVRCVAATAIHDQSSAGHSLTGSRTTYYQSRNRAWFVRRHFPNRLIISYASMAMSGVRLFASDTVKARNYNRTRLYIRGLVHSFTIPEIGRPLEGEPLGRIDGAW